MSADKLTPYLTCTNCGQKSSDTKRCKHCGRPFGHMPQAGDDSSSKRGWFPVVAVGLVAIVAVGLWQWMQRPAAAPLVKARDTTTISIPAETAAVAAPVAPVDTPRIAAPAPVEPPRATVPQESVAAKPAAVAPAPEPIAIDPERQRYAKTWANVRAERNNSAAVLQVLDRGEIVAVDSFQDGWYRVTTDRPVVGYVDQQFLDTVPPGPR
jgi:uncharacterized protein YgiM (DUF1202 family)